MGDIEKEMQLFLIQSMNKKNSDRKGRYDLLKPCYKKSSKYNFNLPILHYENPKEYKRIYRRYYWNHPMNPSRNPVVIDDCNSSEYEA